MKVGVLHGALYFFKIKLLHKTKTFIFQFKWSFVEKIEVLVLPVFI